jgi:hypothetical protein
MGRIINTIPRGHIVITNYKPPHTIAWDEETSLLKSLDVKVVENHNINVCAASKGSAASF